MATARFAAACALIAAPRPAANAQGVPDIGRAMSAPAPARREQVVRLLQARLPRAPRKAIDRAAEGFLDHLRLGSPIAAESLSEGRMDADDLASRLDVFLGGHPEFSSAPGAAAKEGPRMRVWGFLKREPGAPGTDEEGLALADRFIGRLGDPGSLPRGALLSGEMPDDELQSRVALFAADLRTEASVKAEDPAVAAVPSILEAFEKAGSGPVTERPDSLCCRGVVWQKDVKREFVMFRKRPKKLRIHIVEAGLVVGILGFDGTTAWRQVSGGRAEPLGGKAADSLAEAACFDDPLIGCRDRGAVVRLEGGPASGPIRLRIRETDGIESLVTLDRDTFGEISLRRHRPDGRWTEARFLDCRKVGSLRVPFAVEQWDDGTLVSTTRFAEVRPDPGLIDRFFALPSGPDLDFMDFMGALKAIRQGAGRGSAGMQPPGGPP